MLMLRRLLPFVALAAVPLLRLEAQTAADLFRLARARECAELPTAGLRSWFEQGMTPTTALAWPVLQPVRGPQDIATVLDAQPALDVTEFRCQPLRVALADDASVGVVAYAVEVRRTVPDSFFQLGRMLAAWRHRPGRWELEMLVPLHLVNLNRLGVPDAIVAPSAAPPTDGPALALWEADQALGRVAADSGLPVALAERLLPEAVAFPTTGELQIGPQEILAPLRAIPTTWEWAASIHRCE